MNVLMLNTHASRGGAARMAATLAAALRERDPKVEATLFHAGDADVTDGRVGLSVSGFRHVNALYTRLGGRRGALADVTRRPAFRRALDRADVVHLHNLHGYYASHEHVLSTLRDRPVVWTWHDMWPLTGRCAVARDCTGWRDGCRVCPHLDYYPAAWVDRARSGFRRKRALLRDMSRLLIVTPSDWLAELARDAGFDGDRVRVIPNPVALLSDGIPDPSDARRHLGLDATERYALFISADCSIPGKGLDDFMMAMRSVGCKSLVVGDNAPASTTTIRSLGVLRDPDALRRVYAAADVTVVPSSIDNYPNTVIESQSCGTPVVAYRQGGIPSQVHEDAGRLVDVGDVAGLSEGIARVLSRSHSRPALGAWARERWSPDRVAAAYADAYADVWSA